jgi:hypothetical protein
MKTSGQRESNPHFVGVIQGASLVRRLENVPKYRLVRTNPLKFAYFRARPTTLAAPF